jgi:hypothetical protein
LLTCHVFCAAPHEFILNFLGFFPRVFDFCDTEFVQCTRCTQESQTVGFKPAFTVYLDNDACAMPISVSTLIGRASEVEYRNCHCPCGNDQKTKRSRFTIGPHQKFLWVYVVRLGKGEQPKGPVCIEKRDGSVLFSGACITHTYVCMYT